MLDMNDCPRTYGLYLLLSQYLLVSHEIAFCLEIQNSSSSQSSKPKGIRQTLRKNQTRSSNDMDIENESTQSTDISRGIPAVHDPMKLNKRSSLEGSSALNSIDKINDAEAQRQRAAQWASQFVGVAVSKADTKKRPANESPVKESPPKIPKLTAKKDKVSLATLNQKVVELQQAEVINFRKNIPNITRDPFQDRSDEESDAVRTSFIPTFNINTSKRMSNVSAIEKSVIGPQSPSQTAQPTEIEIQRIRAAAWAAKHQIPVAPIATKYESKPEPVRPLPNREEMIAIVEEPPKEKISIASLKKKVDHDSNISVNNDMPIKSPIRDDIFTQYSDEQSSSDLASRLGAPKTSKHTRIATTQSFSSSSILFNNTKSSISETIIPPQPYVVNKQLFPSSENSSQEMQNNSSDESAASHSAFKYQVMPYQIRANDRHNLSLAPIVWYIVVNLVLFLVSFYGLLQSREQIKTITDTLQSEWIPKAVSLIQLFIVTVTKDSYFRETVRPQYEKLQNYVLSFPWLYVVIFITAAIIIVRILRMILKKRAPASPQYKKERSDIDMSQNDSKAADESEIKTHSNIDISSPNPTRSQEENPSEEITRDGDITSLGSIIGGVLLFATLIYFRRPVITLAVFILKYPKTICAILIIIMVLFKLWQLYKLREQRDNTKAEFLAMLTKRILRRNHGGDSFPVDYMFEELLDCIKDGSWKFYDSIGVVGSPAHDSTKMKENSDLVASINRGRLKRIWSKIETFVQEDSRIQRVTTVINGGSKRCWRYQAATKTPMYK